MQINRKIKIMKLELKHIVGYLAYELNTDKGKLIGISNWIGWCGEFKDSTGSTNIPLSAIKPILRPLSDLTKEIEVNGEKFVPIVELAKIKYKSFYEHNIGSRYEEIEITNHNNYAEAYFSFHAGFFIKVWYNSLKEEPNWVIEKLYEWHFDIHGLIEAGLAIDINTLKA